MLKKIFESIVWHTNRIFKSALYSVRILFYPFKKIEGITIKLMQTWAYNVKHHILNSNYESGELQIISNTLKLQDRVLEIGTGLGFLAMYCAKIVGEKNVVSIEANPFLEKYHNEVFRINNIHPIVKYNAIGIIEQEIKFYVDTKYFWSSSLTPFKSAYLKEISVPAIEINNTIQHYNPTFLIMDVEGYEHNIILNIKSFEAITKVQMEIHPEIIGNEKVNEIITTMVKFKFTYNQILSTERQLYFNKE
jgi:FkbM family methyltransferase